MRTALFLRLCRFFFADDFRRLRRALLLEVERLKKGFFLFERVDF